MHTENEHAYDAAYSAEVIRMAEEITPPRPETPRRSARGRRAGYSPGRCSIGGGS